VVNTLRTVHGKVLSGNPASMRKFPFGTFNLRVYRDSPASGGGFKKMMSISKVFYQVEIVRKKYISIIFLFLSHKAFEYCCGTFVFSRIKKG